MRCNLYRCRRRRFRAVAEDTINDDRYLLLARLRLSKRILGRIRPERSPLSARPVTFLSVSYSQKPQMIDSGKITLLQNRVGGCVQPSGSARREGRPVPMLKTAFATILVIALPVSGQTMAGSVACPAPTLNEQTAADLRITEAYLKAGQVAGEMQEARERAIVSLCKEKQPKPTIKCQSRHIGNTVYTDCD